MVSIFHFWEGRVLFGLKIHWWRMENNGLDHMIGCNFSFQFLIFVISFEIRMYRCINIKKMTTYLCLSLQYGFFINNLMWFCLKINELPLFFYNINKNNDTIINVGTNCIRYSNHAGRSQAQYLISYVWAVWEGARPNILSEGERVSKDDQQRKK